MYRKKIAVRAMTVIAAGALLASNVMVAAAQTGGTAAEMRTVQEDAKSNASDNADKSDDKANDKSTDEGAKDDEKDQNQSGEDSKADDDKADADAGKADGADNAGDDAKTDDGAQGSDADAGTDDARKDDSANEDAGNDDAATDAGSKDEGDGAEQEPVADGAQAAQKASANGVLSDGDERDLEIPEEWKYAEVKVKVNFVDTEGNLIDSKADEKFKIRWFKWPWDRVDNLQKQIEQEYENKEIPIKDVAYDVTEIGTVNWDGLFVSDAEVTITLTEKTVENPDVPYTVNFVDAEGKQIEGIESKTEPVPAEKAENEAAAKNYFEELYHDKPFTDKSGAKYKADNVTVDGTTVTVRLQKIEEEKQSKNVYVNYVDREDKPVFTGQIEVDKDATKISTSELTDVPAGWQVAITGDVDIENKNGAWSIKVVVEEKVYTKNVYVNYVDREDKPVFTGQIEVDKDATKINTSELTDVPAGWQVAITGDVDIENEKGAWAIKVVLDPKEAGTKNVLVNYVDRDGNPVFTGQITVSEDVDVINTTELKDVPAGWQIAETGDINIKNEYGAWVIKVTVEAKVYTKNVIINYVDRDGKFVYTGQIQVDENDDAINTSELKDVPYGWQIAITGDLRLNEDGTLTVTVEPKVYTKNVIINYVDRDGNFVYTGQIQVDENDDIINTSELKDVPYGWQVAITGDLRLNEDGTLTVTVEAKVYTKNVIINYVDRDGNFVYTGQIQVDENDDIINTSELKDVPYGWQVAITGDLRLNEDGTLTVTVEPKVYTKNVIINYVDRDGNFVYTGQIQVDENEDIINTSELKDVPYGWQVAITGDLRLNEDGTLTVTVEPKVYTKNVIINYVDRDGNFVYTGQIQVDENDDIINTSELKDVPYGWQVAITGDLRLNDDGTLTVTVEPKVYTKNVIINYVDRDGNFVYTGQIQVDENDDIINTSELKDVPYGWQVAITGDLRLNDDGTLTVTVEPKVYTKNVIINYIDRDGNFVYTGQIQVDENDDIINTSELKDVPYGWQVAITGDLRLNDDGTLTVTVEPKEETTITTAIVTLLKKGTIVGSVTIENAPIDDEEAFKAAINAAIADRNLVVEGKLPTGGWDNNIYKLTVNVTDKEQPEPEDKVSIEVEYKDAEGNLIGKGSVTVNKGDTTVTANQLTDVPKDWVVDGSTFEINGNKVVVTVKPAEEKQDVDATLTVYYKVGDTTYTRQLTHKGTAGKPSTFTAEEILENVPDGYKAVGTVESKVVNFGETAELVVTIELKNNGGNHNGGGSSSGGSSGGGGTRVAAAYGSSGTLANGNWHMLEDMRWEYNYNDGTKARNGWYVLIWQDRMDWYYFDADGYLVSGWYTDANGVKYYLHPQHDGTFGRMYTGWNKVDGAWQHFNDNTEQGVYGAWEQGMPVPTELANL